MPKYDFTEGEVVYWTDPDDGLCSGNARVLSGNKSDDDYAYVAIGKEPGDWNEVPCCELQHNPWADDHIQFPRLIAEINAVMDRSNLIEIAESMDLSVEKVEELLDRADQSWETIKSEL